MKLDMRIDWHRAATAIRMMREDGMNDTRIACAVGDIAMAAVAAERRRVEQRLQSDLVFPPTLSQLEKQIAENVEP